jgi:hypothetical protein
MTDSQASADASCNDRCFGFVADNGRGRPDKSTEGTTNDVLTLGARKLPRKTLSELQKLASALL